MKPLPDNAPRTEWLQWTQYLLDSYARWVGSQLLPRGTPEEDLLALWHAPRVVLAHGVEADPVFHYGNQQALELWGLRLDELLGMPSRLTAEPLHRDERQRLLERTQQHGFVDDYRGVRISKSGQRFWIERALLWTVLDAHGQRIGQAATFDRWTPLTDSPTTAPDA
jgi:PAS domain S-box-containing protein